MLDQGISTQNQSLVIRLGLAVVYTYCMKRSFHPSTATNLKGHGRSTHVDRPEPELRNRSRATEYNHSKRMGFSPSLGGIAYIGLELMPHSNE